PPHVPEPCDSVTALLCDPFPLVRALLPVSPPEGGFLGAPHAASRGRGASPQPPRPTHTACRRPCYYRQAQV
ncbi:rCG57399, partial [Rattus norvegicus]